jgi:8-oxo-dGTP diphosphatase
MISVKFFAPDHDPETKLTYSVISGRFRGKWMFVRHSRRTTWEIAGGHIEPGETAYQAAGREFREETGAREFSLVCIATYSVEQDGHTGYGRLFHAEVYDLGTIPSDSEIAELRLDDTLPENLTHPDIQPLLFRKATEYLMGTGTLQ